MPTSRVRLAETLGTTIEAFYEDGETTRQIAQTVEMFRLWAVLTSAAVRGELLNARERALRRSRRFG